MNTKEKKMQRVGFDFKGKRISVECKKCNSLQKAIGLMFSRREKAKALLFSFKKPSRISIHSLFVFFPFVAVWLGEKGKIVDKKLVKPFTLIITPKKDFLRLIEIPINEKYKNILKLVGD